MRKLPQSKRITVLVAASVLLLCACRSSTPNISSIPSINQEAIINNMPVDIPLVPFFERDDTDTEIRTGFGYAHSETLEIIIPGEYQTATNFVGDYAVVQKEYEGKYSIINKNNIEVMSNFDNAHLYQLDNGAVLAVTQNYHGWEVRDTGFFGRGYAQGPEKITFRLYDLNRGVLLKTDADGDPEIIIIDNYIIYYEAYQYFDIYEINMNGGLEKVNIAVKDFFAKIIQEKDLRYKENNFLSDVSYLGQKYSYINMPDEPDPHRYPLEHGELKFGLFDSLDINELIRKAPDNMKLKTRGNNVDNPEYDIDIINWGNIGLGRETYPFKKRDYLYRVGLRSPESGDKYIEYHGLYDSAGNRWVIPPIAGIPPYAGGSAEFFFLDDNWVVYQLVPSDGYYWIYNTRTQKKHEAAFIGANTLSPRKKGYYLYFHNGVLP